MENKFTITVSFNTYIKDGNAACSYYIKHEKFVVKDSEFLGEVNNKSQADYQALIRTLTRTKKECQNRIIKWIYITSTNKDVLDQCAIQFNNPESELFELLRYQKVIPQHIDEGLDSVAPRLWIINTCKRLAKQKYEEVMKISDKIHTLTKG